MIDSMRRRFAALVLAPLVLLPLAGCGYSLAGRGSALPAHIKTIGVPLFTNATTVFDVEQTLTQRVRLEFIGRGRYKVVPDDAGIGLERRVALEGERLDVLRHGGLERPRDVVLLALVGADDEIDRLELAIGELRVERFLGQRRHSITRTLRAPRSRPSWRNRSPGARARSSSGRGSCSRRTPTAPSSLHTLP